MWGKGVPSEVTAHTVAAVEECSGKELHDGSKSVGRLVLYILAAVFHSKSH